MKSISNHRFQNLSEVRDFRSRFQITSSNSIPVDTSERLILKKSWLSDNEIDFGNNLKSVLTSLVYTDVNQDDVLFTTINQWFDESIFYENTIKNLYYPSVNYKEFKKYNEKFFERFKIYPNEITILAYDALGLIYYAWNNNGNEINSINNFIFKSKIKGKIGTFSFKGKKVTQELEIYKTDNKKFTKF